MGKRCERTFDLAAVEAEAQKKKKILAWTYVHRNNKYIEVDWFSHDNRGDFGFHQYFNSNPDFLVFHLSCYRADWMRANRRYNARHVAVHKNDAIRAGVITNPTSYIKSVEHHAEIWQPNCPVGFKEVSHAVRYYPMQHTKDVENKYKRGAVHCINKKYIINEH